MLVIENEIALQERQVPGVRAESYGSWILGEYMEGGAT
jgi:hypothetical protein